MAWWLTSKLKIVYCPAVKVQSIQLGQIFMVTLPANLFLWSIEAIMKITVILKNIWQRESVLNFNPGKKALNKMQLQCLLQDKMFGLSKFRAQRICNQTLLNLFHKIAWQTICCLLLLSKRTPQFCRFSRTGKNSTNKIHSFSHFIRAGADKFFTNECRA